MELDQGINSQEIQFTGNNNFFSFPVYGSDVLVNASKIDLTESNMASNKVRFSQISKYNWEEKFYQGNLVSCNSNFVAYVLKRNKEDKGDQIRIINHQTSTRQLVHGPKKEIIDICFESVKSNFLGVVDSEGTLFVFDVDEKNPGKILVNLIIAIKRDVKEEDHQHLIWAPYLLLSKDAHEPMIALSNGVNAEVYYLKKIQEELNLDSDQSSENKIYMREELGASVRLIKDCHTQTISCLAVSPDTNVLVTCSLDGHVKFWSLNSTDIENSVDDILQEWVPHDGQPVTSLLFCDDLMVPVDVNPFWRYLITATEKSSILKVWCTVTWDCLQTLRLGDYVDQIPSSSPCMKVSLDISAKYLILADIHRPVLYICYLSQAEKEKLLVTSMSEFILKEPLLCFTILSAKDYKSQVTAEDSHNVGMLTGIDGEADHSIEDIEDDLIDKKVITSVKLFAIQKREVQRLSIKYSADHSLDLLPPLSTAASSQEDLMSIKDGLSDIDAADVFSADKLLLLQDSPLCTDESIASSITAITNVTVNGDHGDEEELVPEEIVLENDTSLLSSIVTSRQNSLTDNDNLLSSIITSRQNSLTETVPIVVKESDIDTDLAVSVTEEAITNDISSLSLSESHSALPIDHHDSSIIFAVPTPREERAAILNRSNSDPVPTQVLTKTSETQQLVALLDTQRQVLKNQQQILIEQQKELKELKGMMKQVIHRQNETPVSTSDPNDRDDLKVYMQLWQKNTNKEFNKVCSQKLDQLSKNMDMAAEQRENKNLNILSNLINSTIAIKVENTIKQEMKPLVINSLEKMHAKLAEKVNIQVAQTLTDKVAHATGIMQGAMPNAFSEMFAQIILPGFEKALTAMFAQVDKLFRVGTSQYLEHLSKHLDGKRQKQQEAQDPLLGHLQELIQSFQATADRLTSGVETNLEALMQKQLCDSLEKMQNNFCKTIESRVVPSISESISKSLAGAMEEFKTEISESLSQSMQQSAVFQQQDSTVKSEQESMSIILRLVEQGNFNKAFEEALTASNLSLVMFLCKKIEPNGIFQDASCPFPQPTILSLIQQLSVNLGEETETKRRYLEESIMALDRDDEITREHLPVVLQGLNEQLNQTIDHILRTDPANIQLKPLKMLLMASRSLLHGS